MIKCLKITFKSIIISCLLMIQIIPINAVDTTDKKIVKVSSGINEALYLDEDGNPSGYCSTFIQQIAVNNNWQLEYVDGSWNEHVENLKNGKIDLLLPTQMTTERKETMLFSDYICGYQKIGLYAKKDAEIFYDDYQAFNNKKVAISSNTSNKEVLDEYCQKNSFSYIPVDIASVEDKIQALEDGTVDMISISTLNNIKNGKIVAVLDSLPCYITTNINNQELMNELNKGISELLISSPNVATDMFNKILTGETIVSLTRYEYDVVKLQKEIKIGISKDTLPLSGIDSNGKPIGIYPDIIKTIKKDSGLNIKIIVVDRKKRLYDELRKGKFDFVIGSNRLPYISGSVEDLSLSSSIMDYTTVGITKSNYKFTKDQTPVFALTKLRKYLKSYILSKYPKAQIKYYDDAKKCLAAVKNNTCDVTMLNTWEYNYYSKNSRFSDLTEWENLRTKCDLIIGTMKNTDKDILSIIEKTIGQMSSSAKDEIITSNLNMTYDSYDRDDSLYSLKQNLPTYGIVILSLVALFVFYIFMKHRNERSLRIKNKELQLANNAKSDFLSRMSHELRTPLNAIAGYNNIMLQSINDDLVDKNVFKINLKNTERASKYLLAIINDILDAQNVELGKIKLVKEDVNATEYMDNICEMVSQEAKDKGIEFIYTRLTNVSDHYSIDTIRLQQILLNVLHNAIKFTPAGGTVKVNSSGKRNDDGSVTLKFVVTDNGIGMSKEFVDNELFKKFAQENHDITSPYEGCGNGLAITKELVELMDGSITCDSIKGEGTTFTILVNAFPIKKIIKKRSRPTVNYDLQGKKVLICEDNVMNQDIERKILEKMKCDVVIANDGEIGVKMFNDSEINYFDIILMDIRMPNLNGLDATKRIRNLNREDATTIPIVAVSANAFESDIKESLDSGMNDHLAKPVSAKMLYETILKYCKER